MVVFSLQGNTFYETNNFAGGIAAIMLMPGLAEYSNITTPQITPLSTLINGKGIKHLLVHKI